MIATKIYPSVKPIIPLYLFSGVLLALVLYYLTTKDSTQDSMQLWLLGFPAAVVVYAIVQHLMSRATSLTIEGELLKYQSGVGAKVQRTMVIEKLQDVRVDQSMWQRIWGVGDLTLETAGDSSHLTMSQIDKPAAVAEMLHQKMQKTQLEKRNHGESS